MLTLIQISYLIISLTMLAYLFFDLRAHDNFLRHVWKSWVGLLALYSVIPIIYHFLFQMYPEALKDFFPEGPVGPATGVCLMFGWLFGIELWLLFKLFLWIEAKIWMWRHRN